MKTRLILLILATAALASCNNSEKDFDASGVFETTEVIVSAKASGEISGFNVEEGSLVSIDSVLGYIDTTQLALKKEQLEKTRKSTSSKNLSDNQLASLKRQIANAKREKKRFEELVANDAATQKQLDDINYQIIVLESQLQASEEQLNKNNSAIDAQSDAIASQIDQVKEQMSDAIIKSPITGVILSKYAENGEYATNGKALFKIGNIDRMRLRAYITADQLTSIKIGQKVKVYADKGENDRQEYDGTISWISQKAEFTPKTIQTRDERANLVYAIKIEVKNDGYIKSGMYGDVKFSQDTNK